MIILSRRDLRTGVLSERYMSVYSQTSNFELADVIVRGHDDYTSLSKSEKLAFGHYLENMCIANEGALWVLIYPISKFYLLNQAWVH